jgi:hypothetical protein
MSWSSPDPSLVRRREYRQCVRSIFVVAVMASVPGFAAEVYVQPVASISAEYNSNLDLQPGPNRGVEGYVADLATIVGIATPDSNTTLRPRIDYRDYPADPTDNRLEEYLDLNTAYRGQRSKASMYLGYERRDEFNAELSAAQYSDFAPVSPTSPETGRTIVGAVRTSLIALPDYSYLVTERVAAGVSGIYQQLNYSPEGVNAAIDFRYYQAKAYLRWAVDQKNDLTLGGYGSNYEAAHFYSRATAGGTSLQLDTSWTPLLTTAASVTYQRTSIDTTIPKPLKTDVNPWGASFSTMYKTDIQQFRLDAGRVITPSGGGGIYVNDQLQFQYNRAFTQRLSFTGAAIALRNRGLTSNVSGADRTYYRAVVDLKWMMTRTFFLQGGYQYMWQKFQVETYSASNDRIYVRFGYQGLGRQF